MNIEEIKKHLKNEVIVEVRRQEMINGKFEPWYKNKELSMQAKGVMHYLWDQLEWTNKTNIKFITYQFGNSEYEVKCALNELIKVGYLVAYKTKNKRVRFDLFRSKFRCEPKVYIDDLL